MIRVLDNNALVHLHREGLAPKFEHRCFVPLEIADEFLGGQDWFDRLPLASPKLDEAEYLAAYARHLNSFKAVNFYSLKGFGDVGILATLELLVRQAPATRSLSKEIFPEDLIFLVSDDGALRKQVARCFGEAVELEMVEAFLGRCR